MGNPISQDGVWCVLKIVQYGQQKSPSMTDLIDFHSCGPFQRTVVSISRDLNLLV